MQVSKTRSTLSTNPSHHHRVQVSILCLHSPQIHFTIVGCKYPKLCLHSPQIHLTILWCKYLNSVLHFPQIHLTIIGCKYLNSVTLSTNPSHHHMVQVSKLCLHSTNPSHHHRVQVSKLCLHSPQVHLTIIGCKYLNSVYTFHKSISPS